MWLTLLGRFWYVPVIALMAVAVHHYRTELRVTTAEYAAFQSKVEALGEQARLHKVEKEGQDAKQIADAVTGRNDALARLRVAEANSRSSRVSLTPAAAAGSDYLCFTEKTFAAAVERYRGGVRSIVTQGAEASIDATALIKAWPKAN